MLHITDEKVPLATDERGLMRIAGTRVTLDCVVEMFDDGASPEEIVEQYDALQLGDVYAVITYYLRHRADVQEFLSSQRSEGEKTRRTVQEAVLETLREKLLDAHRRRECRDRKKSP